MIEPAKDGGNAWEGLELPVLTDIAEETNTLPGESTVAFAVGELDIPELTLEDLGEPTPITPAEKPPVFDLDSIPSLDLTSVEPAELSLEDVLPRPKETGTVPSLSLEDIPAVDLAMAINPTEETGLVAESHHAIAALPDWEHHDDVLVLDDVDVAPANMLDLSETEHSDINPVDSAIIVAPEDNHTPQPEMVEHITPTIPEELATIEQAEIATELPSVTDITQPLEPVFSEKPAEPVTIASVEEPPVAPEHTEAEHELRIPELTQTTDTVDLDTLNRANEAEEAVVTVSAPPAEPIVTEETSSVESLPEEPSAITFSDSQASIESEPLLAEDGSTAIEPPSTIEALLAQAASRKPTFQTIDLNSLPTGVLGGGVGPISTEVQETVTEDTSGPLLPSFLPSDAVNAEIEQQPSTLTEELPAVDTTEQVVPEPVVVDDTTDVVEHTDLAVDSDTEIHEASVPLEQVVEPDEHPSLNTDALTDIAGSNQEPGVAVADELVTEEAHPHEEPQVAEANEVVAQDEGLAAVAVNEAIHEEVTPPLVPVSLVEIPHVVEELSEEAPVPALVPANSSHKHTVEVLNVASVQSLQTSTVTPPPVPTPIHTVAVVDEKALVDIMYDKILPQMKQELSAWLQDALESQTRQMLTGVMEQLKEDYEMIFGEALRESVKKAVKSLSTHDKGGDN